LFIFIASCRYQENQQEVGSTETQQVSETVSVMYDIAANYFLKNTVTPGQLPQNNFETQADCDKVFGMATTQGDTGKPTVIDFENQFVIAVSTEETNVATEIQPLSLQKDTSGQLTLTYRRVQGETMGHTIAPVLLLIVAKADNETVVIKEQ